MKRRLTFNITLKSESGTRQASIDGLNAKLTEFLEVVTKDTDETVEFSMYVNSSKNGD